MCDASPRSPEPVDLREQVAAALWDDAERTADREDRYSWDYVIEHAARWPDLYGPVRDRVYATADAVMAVFRAEAERDAAVREAAALRAGVEVVLDTYRADIPWQVEQDLRAILAAHPGETNGDDRG